MVNIFQIAVERLSELGFYNFLLPFILFSAVLYAVLRKTQILGDSPLIHGIISVGVGLFVFGVPVLAGVNLAGALTSFLTQAAIVILVFVVAFLIASFFYPNITELVERAFPKPGPGGWVIWTVVGIAAALGLFVFVGKPFRQLFAGLKIPGELLVVTIAIVIILVVFIILAISRQVER